MVVRGDRRLLRVYGRAPVQMLDGIVTSRIPQVPVVAGGLADSTTLTGDAVYGTMLTAKGRMVSDVVTLWLGAGEEEGLGLSVAEVAHEAVLAHFSRFLPPRLARVEDIGAATRLLTVLGPGAGEVVAAVFEDAPMDGFMLVDGGPLGGGALVARGVRQVASWDVWVAADALSGVRDRLREHGAVPVGSGAWDTLRVEAGFPEFGIDMDDEKVMVRQHRRSGHRPLTLLRRLTTPPINPRPSSALSAE